MPRRIAITFTLLLMLPLFGLALFSWQLTSNRNDVHEMQRRQLVDARLERFDVQIRDWLREQNASLQPLANDNAASIRMLQSISPLLKQVHVLGEQGFWLHPLVPEEQLKELSADVIFASAATEVPLRQRPAPVWYSRREASPSAEAPMSSMNEVASSAGRRGWLVRYEQQQLQLLRWMVAPDGAIWLFEISYPKLLAGLIGWLPDTPAEINDGSELSLAKERYRLRDASGRTLYEWGGFDVPEAAAPLAQIALSHPLGSWKLEYFSTRAVASTFFQRLWWILVAAVIAVLSLLLGQLFWRQQRAELERAAQRVSFVNQVSHELKTPLTNIRLYAELLQQRLLDSAQNDPVSRRQLGVVVSESQRLSRLINNVLSFGRRQRGQLQLQYGDTVPDDVVREVLANWEMALADVGMAVEFTAAANQCLSIDADALEQILNNLIGNAEKYAAMGGVLRIDTVLTPGQLVITVADNGSGIPASDQQRVFEPFFRRSDKTTEGVSGTGIGLGLARELARLHGGDLRLLDSAGGCIFEITLLANGTGMP